MELTGQVLRQGTGMRQRPDQCALRLAVVHRSMGIQGMLGLDGKAGVVRIHKRWPEGIGGLPIRDRLKPQFLDQAILQGLVSPLHASLRLGTAGVNGLDIECLEGPGKRRQFPFTFRTVHSEETVSVTDQRDRTTILIEILSQGLPIGPGGLGRDKAQCHQSAGGIINKHDPGAGFGPALEPIVWRAVDLDQFPETRTAGDGGDGSGPGGGPSVATILR